jgi:hypothetical protein
VIDRLAGDLKLAFPGVRGFSRTSLHYMRQFALEWDEGELSRGAWTKSRGIATSRCSTSSQHAGLLLAVVEPDVLGVANKLAHRG